MRLVPNFRFISRAISPYTLRVFATQPLMPFSPQTKEDAIDIFSSLDNLSYCLFGWDLFSSIVTAIVSLELGPSQPSELSLAVVALGVVLWWRNFHLITSRLVGVMQKFQFLYQALLPLLSCVLIFGSLPVPRSRLLSSYMWNSRLTCGEFVAARVIVLRFLLVKSD